MKNIPALLTGLFSGFAIGAVVVLSLPLSERAGDSSDKVMQTGFPHPGDTLLLICDHMNEDSSITIPARSYSPEANPVQYEERSVVNDTVFRYRSTDEPKQFDSTKYYFDQSNDWYYEFLSSGKIGIAFDEYLRCRNLFKESASKTVWGKKIYR